MTKNISTNDFNSNPPHRLLLAYSIWIGNFFTTAIPSLVIVATVLRYSALRNRKEFLIIAGLAFTDFLGVTTFTMSGLRRVILIYTNQWTAKRSFWYCATLPDQILSKLAVPTNGLMLLVISLDRLIAVSVPLTYYSLTAKYAHRTVGMVYLIGSINCLSWIGISISHRNDHIKVAPVCWMAPLMVNVNKLYALLHMSSLSISAFLSVVVYVGVVVVYWKRKQNLINRTTDQSHVARERNRQRRLTKNLALSSLCTTILMVIPNLIIRLIQLNANVPNLWWVTQYIWILSQLNGLCNVVIYYKKQPELRKGMKALFRNKMMPSNLDLWNVAAVKRGVVVPKVANRQAVAHVEIRNADSPDAIQLDEIP